MSHTSAGLSINSSAKLAVITVVYQNYEVLTDLFTSLNKQTDKNFHLFISDLSEEKKTIDSLNIPYSTFHIPNKGYAYGINFGLKKAIELGYDKFCVINDDTYVQHDFIHKSISSIMNHKSSIMGGKIYYAPGFEYYKLKYKKDDLGKVLWYAGGDIDWKNVFITHRGVDQIDKNQFDKVEETEFVTGCLMCFDKTVVDKIGFWDEKYFLYYEDADYCIRAQKKGIKLYYDPSIIIWHKNAQSTGGSGSKLHQKYQEKNRLRFALKYALFKTKLAVVKNFLTTFSIWAVSRTKTS